MCWCCTSLISWSFLKVCSACSAVRVFWISLANVAASKSLLAAEQAGVAFEAKEAQAKQGAKTAVKRGASESSRKVGKKGGKAGR